MKRLIKIVFAWMIVAGFATRAAACTNIPISKTTNDSISKEIKKQLKAHLPLQYPKSVKRFYEQNKFSTVWIKTQTGEGPAWHAMLMIDCVLQFGLSHADYHPLELTYQTLHHLLDTPGKADAKAEARFEIMLTDAVITFINNLHFGKLNPDYPPAKADQLNKEGFNADNFLMNALKASNLFVELAKAQPDIKEYTDLQNHMRLLAGTYQGDCYEVPESDIRKMAINMERLRWQYTTGKPAYITCLIKEGVIVYYDDIYKKDEALEAAMYKNGN
jgi:murein L,D-transpeptidase YcbB/YkuD